MSARAAVCILFSLLLSFYLQSYVEDEADQKVMLLGFSVEITFFFDYSQ